MTAYCRQNAQVFSEIYHYEAIIMKKIRLCILFGGKSSEYEVSLLSAYSVLTNADPEKYDIIPVGITRDGLWTLWQGDYAAIADGSWCDNIASLPRVSVDLSPDARALLVRDADGSNLRSVPVDVVFPVLHGAFGEDGRVQGLLASAGIPFVGCDSASSAVCMDKALTKSVAGTLGIRQANCLILRRREVCGREDAVAAEAEEKLGYPIFVKPARTGSSVGVTKAKNREQLLSAMAIAFREDDKILMEEAIVGQEIETAVFEENGICTVSDCAEIVVAGAEFYDYDAKYITDSSVFHIPARIPDTVREEVRRTAEAIFRVLDCRTLARVDFFVQEDGSVVFNEINNLPGFTSISMYPKLMMHTGMSYGELIDRLVRSAMGSKA